MVKHTASISLCSALYVIDARWSTVQISLIKVPSCVLVQACSQPSEVGGSFSRKSGHFSEKSGPNGLEPQSSALAIMCRGGSFQGWVFDPSRRPLAMGLLLFCWGQYFLPETPMVGRGHSNQHVRNIGRVQLEISRVLINFRVLSILSTRN